MKRTEKEQLVIELKDKMKGATALYYTDFTGLNVKRMTDLRRRLRKAGVRVRRDQEHARAARGERKRPDGRARSRDRRASWWRRTRSAAAKVLTDFAKENDQRPTVKGGLFEGEVDRRGAGEEAGHDADARADARRARRRHAGVRWRCCARAGRMNELLQNVRRSARGAASAAAKRRAPESPVRHCLTRTIPASPGITSGELRTMANATLSKDEILDAIGNMSVFELAELIEAFKTKFNVTIAAAAGWRRLAVAARLRPPRRRRADRVRRRAEGSRRARRSRSSRSCANSPASA